MSGSDSATPDRNEALLRALLQILDDGGWGVVAAHLAGCENTADERDSIRGCTCAVEIYAVQGEIPTAS